jgi:hypothetical protein
MLITNKNVMGSKVTCKTDSKLRVYGKKEDRIESVVQIFGCMLYRSSTLIATTGAASEIIMKKKNWERHPPFTKISVYVLIDEDHLTESALQLLGRTLEKDITKDQRGWVIVPEQTHRSVSRLSSEKERKKNTLTAP